MCIRDSNNTRLLLDHSGFDLDNPQHSFAFENMGPGWTNDILPGLASMLEAS